MYTPEYLEDFTRKVFEKMGCSPSDAKAATKVFITAEDSSLSIVNLFRDQSQEQPSFHFIFELEDIYPIHFDLLTDKCVYHIFFDPLLVPSIEDKILILLKQYAYEEIYDRSLDYIGFMNVATGMIIQYEVSSTIREQLSQLWLHLQQKYAPRV